MRQYPARWAREPSFVSTWSWAEKMAEPQWTANRLAQHYTTSDDKREAISDGLYFIQYILLFSADESDQQPEKKMMTFFSLRFPPFFLFLKRRPYIYTDNNHFDGLASFSR